MVTIYALIDPSSSIVKYIGQTTGNVKKRLSQHIYASNKKKTYVQKWIYSILNEGRRPIIKELLKVDKIISDDTERFFISHYGQFCKLTNGTPGGEGGKGRIVPNEEIERRRKSGQYESARIRMMGPNNPGKRQIKKIFYIYKTEEEKRKSFLANSDRMKKNNPMKNPVISNKVREKNKLMGTRCKKILQYDVNGNFIKEWSSIRLAANALNVHETCISRAVIGYLKTSAGYIWKTKNN